MGGAAVVVSLVLVATSLHGLTSNAHVVGKPESTKAADGDRDARFRRRRPICERQVSDVVVVSSDRYGVDSPQFRSLVARLVRAAPATTGKVISAQSYLSGNRSLVSRDGHATLVQLFVGERRGDQAGRARSCRRRADTPASPSRSRATTPSANDFNTLSQSDLEHGELDFGLPAALVVLVLVFGAVVAGLVPVLMAILSILVGLGLVALLSLEFSLSVFIVNMLTGMGLALGIDYSLFVISRFREERTRGLEQTDAIASPARPRAGRCCSAAAPSSSPCSGCCSCRRRSCAASPPARSSSASSRSPPR